MNAHLYESRLGTATVCRTYMAAGGTELKIPIFQSSLASDLRGFIALRQSLGYQVRTLIVYLKHFDRYVVTTGYDKEWLSRNLVEGWVASTALLKPGSRAHRLHVMRDSGSVYRRDASANVCPRAVGKMATDVLVPPPYLHYRRDPFLP
jgi:hypothetical protein